MNSLILKYAEQPQEINVNELNIEYSDVQNLTIIKNTEKPAINCLGLETQTITRSSTEPTDSDNDMSSQLLQTNTVTDISTEPSDADKDYEAIRTIMQTQTVTESCEPTDSDR
jgi:hypothetical protein